jgi:hypothetical protein
MDSLTEDREDIQRTIDFMNRYMKSKRSHPLYSVYLPDYIKFQKLVVYPWLDETFVYERDYSSEEERKIINEILDYFNNLKTALK